MHGSDTLLLLEAVLTLRASSGSRLARAFRNLICCLGDSRRVCIVSSGWDDCGYGMSRLLSSHRTTWSYSGRGMLMITFRLSGSRHTDGKSLLGMAGTLL